MFDPIRPKALLLVLAAILLSGCGDANEDLAARVNQEPITHAEVDALLARRELAPDQAGAAQRAAALEELITQRLMAQGAYELELDDDPGVVLASHELLARAYLKTRLTELPRPDQNAVTAYYQAHPELFGERRRYQLQQIAVQASGADLAAVAEHYRTIGTLNELVTWLEQRGLPFQSGAAIKAAEELPRDLLQYLKDAREGEVVKIDTPSGMSVLQVVSISSDPLPLGEAEDDIRKYLRNRQVERMLQQVDAELRAKAKIERYPPYAQP